MNDMDSVRFTPVDFAIESVNDTDSERFTPVVFETESVKLRDSESAHLVHMGLRDRICQLYRF